MISRTPLRITFAGGGTDLPAFADARGGAVVSTTIDKYVYVVVSKRFGDTIRVSYSKTEIVEGLDDLEHPLVREALRVAGVHHAVEVVTIADVPAHGTGLGSSSALTVGLLQALFAYQGIDRSANELAADAARIEIEIVGKPIGRQDQYVTAHGGLQSLRFDRRGEVRRERLAMPQRELERLERNLLLFYTGRQREAASVLAGVQQEIARSETAVATLELMRDSAIELAGALAAEGSANLVGRALHKDWERKRSLHPTVSNPGIDRLCGRALDAGALGARILGAGGGGFLLVYASAENHVRVRAALRELSELPFGFEREGSRIVFSDRE